MTTVLMVLLLIMLTVCLLLFVLVAIDVMTSHRQAKEQPAPIIIEKNVVQEKIVPVQPVAQPVVEEVAAAEEVAEEEQQPAIEEGAIVFSANKKTHKEKYEMLTKQEKKWYDEIAVYAQSMEKAKLFSNDRYEEYKVGKNRLVRLTIKKGVIVCEFILPNSDFKNFVADNDVEVKQAPVIMKITDAEMVKAAKESVNISMNIVNEEKARKAEIAKERRRAKRLEKAQENN